MGRFLFDSRYAPLLTRAAKARISAMRTVSQKARKSTCRAMIVAYLVAGIPLARAQNIANREFRDTAVIPSFHERNPDIVYFQTFLRQPLDSRHTVLLVRGGFPGPGWSDEQLPMEDLFVDPRDLLGLFLMETANPDLVWELILLDGQETAGRVEIERVGGSSIVLARDDGDYGIGQESLKIFIDVSSRRVLKKVRFWPAAIRHIVVTADTLQLIADAKDETLALQWQDSRPVVLTGPEEARAFGRLSDRAPETVLPIGDDGRFSVALESSSSEQQVRGILEGQDDAGRLHKLPQSTIEDLTHSRPGSEDLKVAESIGPYRMMDGRFWFGKTFYDGEGMTGVGGVGYFDAEQQRFVLFSPLQIAPWSTSALLVENGIVWAGLTRRPEGGVYSGGLLRFEPASGEAHKYEIPEVILAIERWKDNLFLGTNNGLYRLRDNDKWQRFVIEPALRGGWEIVEHLP